MVLCILSQASQVEQLQAGERRSLCPGPLGVTKTGHARHPGSIVYHSEGYGIVYSVSCTV